MLRAQCEAHMKGDLGLREKAGAPAPRFASDGRRRGHGSWGARVGSPGVPGAVGSSTMRIAARHAIS